MSRRLAGIGVSVGIAVALCGTVTAGPLKVYVLAGQSNMEGHARIETFDHLAMDPETVPLVKKMRAEDGTPRTCKRVWISYRTADGTIKEGKLTAGYGALGRGPKIGPEFTFGISLEERTEDPILIIKTAWGGKSLHTDFRPPSAGPHGFSEQQLQNFEKQGKNVEELKAKRVEATGHYYRRMIGHVKKVLADPKQVCPEYDAEAGYELAGFVWFQGWNDMVDRGVYPKRGTPGGYDAYTEAMAHFIRDVRKDLRAPQMPFVIGVMGVGGDIASRPPNRYTPIHLAFREAMAAPADMPEFKGNVFAVQTYKCWDEQLSELQGRKGKIKAKEAELTKAGELNKEQIREAVDNYRREIYTDKELEILRKGVSNQEFHYLGSGKIMARIGVAFADALTGKAAP